MKSKTFITAIYATVHRLALFVAGLTILTVVLTVVLTAGSTAHAIPIKVVTEYLPPFQSKNNDGTLGGYSTEVVHALFALTGDRPNIQLLPWSRGYRMAQEEHNVMIYSIARTSSRESLFHWVGALKNERFYVWGLKTKYNQPFCSLDEFKYLIFASSKNYNTEQFLLQNHFKTIQRVGKNDQTIGMLYKGRADLIVGNELIFQHQARRLKLDFNAMVKLYETTSLNTSISIAFGLNSDDAIIKRFEQAFKQLQSSGKLATIKKKWTIEDDKKSSLLASFPQSKRRCK